MDQNIAANGNADLKEYIADTLVVRMSSGYEAIIPFANRREAKRTESAIQDSSAYPFVVFDAPNHRVALNARQFTYCHFLWDAGVAPAASDRFAQSGFDEADVEDGPIPDGIRFWFNSGGRPERFSVNRDDFSEGLDDVPEIGGVFTFLESFDDDDLITFEDDNSERVFLRASHIALCCVPLEIVDKGRAVHNDAIEKALETTGSENSVH